MGTKPCRLCGAALAPEPVLRLDGMPKAAQHFPEPAEFAADTGVTLVVRQCSGCGLVQLDRHPVGYYREVITAATLSERSRASRLEQVRALVSRFGIAGRTVLEVGAGTGEMLDVLAEAGLRPTGLEAGPDSVAAGRSRGRTMVEGYIGEVSGVEGAPFDAVVSLNYLEHLPDPGRIIRRLHELTAAGATGYVTVPNLEYLLATRCYYEFVADHLSYFTRRTLTHAFEANGFEVVACETINEENDIAATVRRREVLDLSRQYGEVEELLGRLRRIVAERVARGQKVAVWGAGHRTLALMALAGLDRVAYVVDSAKFKQGRSTPVLHLDVSAPERLLAEPVGLVLVMVPGLYPLEVTRTLLRMGTGADVAVLRGNAIDFLPDPPPEG